MASDTKIFLSHLDHANAEYVRMFAQGIGERTQEVHILPQVTP